MQDGPSVVLKEEPPIAAAPPDGPRAEPERWHVSGPPGLERWGDVLAATHLGFEVSGTERTPHAFQGAVTRRRFGGLALVDCAASPFLGRRPDALLEDSAEPIIGFQFLRRGVELVRESWRELALAPGSVILWDSLQPVEVEVVQPFAKRTLIFPRDRVLAVCPRLAEVKAIPPLTPHGGARLLIRYLSSLASELPGLDGPAGDAAADAALELLRAAVEPNVPTSRSAKRAALRSEVRRYIRASLHNPHLGPETIARARAISVRALHALYEDTGDSVAGIVRRERLSRCREDLGLVTGGSVTEIAFRWGFRDAAHFSRVFKREYGVTPREFRRGAVEAA